MAKRTSIFIILLALAGCLVHSQNSVPADTVIRLKRFADGFGSGGFYKLTITGDGAVEVTQTRNPRREYKPEEPDSKTIKSSIAIGRLAELVADINRIKYFSLKDEYTTSDDGCTRLILDQGGAETSVTMDGRTKTILHYYGCRRSSVDSIYPEELTSFERKIDEIVGTKGLLKQ
jgi:hypothetical protein